MATEGGNKKTSRQVIEGIINSLRKGPKSIFEVAQETETTWESAKRYLEMLKNIEMAEETEEGNKRVFRLKRCAESVERMADTIFGIPILPKEQENTINFLFMKIRDVWKEKTGSYPGKTQIQKVLVDVAYKCRISIPTGWYMFGELCIKNYDPLVDYPFEDKSIDNKDMILKCIDEVIEEDKKHNANYLRKKQYLESRNVLYLRQYEFVRYFDSVQLTEENKAKLIEMLTEITLNLPRTEDNIKAAELLNDLIRTVIYIIRNIKSDEIDVIRADILEAINAVWQAVAIHNLFESLSKNPYYNKNLLLPYFENNFRIFETVADEHISNIRELCKIDELKETDFKGFEKIRALKGSVKEKKISREERKKAAEEFAKDDSDLFRKFGIN
jgi:predicted transcriptional regulator